MSRSYKKTPIAQVKSNCSKWWKSYYNRKLRRKKLLVDFQNMSYKKHNNSWEIVDYKDICPSYDEFLTFWGYDDTKETKRLFYTSYLNK